MTVSISPKRSNKSIKKLGIIKCCWIETTLGRHYITPATGIPRNLLSITFGSNIPPKFKTISDEEDTSSLEEEVHFGDYNFQMLKLSLIQLQQLGKSGEIRVSL
ncbi:hypothetical protein H5410_046705 [Solanum commersonii]|uniref:Uncharacterized protein n=1 Tax=Solanum commersonii TaxID=4109 RepID=A0A9J5XF61_SOLCO|nr:hypothetical protein H5410_046705 [Solanum commersonii]